MPGDSPRITLADIAKHAGVSEASVSRVLNGKSGVSEETRQAVVVALDILGYQRPERLRRRSAGLVGLITPELENPIFPLFAQMIEAALFQHGYTPVLCTHQTAGGASEEDYVETLLDRSVAGIIFLSGNHADTRRDPEQYQRLLARPLPIVLINGYMPGVDAPFISVDEGGAAMMAVAHLASLGHQRIGLISGPERYVPVQRKLDGYRAQMAAAGLAEEVELTRFGVEGGYAAADRLIQRDVTGIVCGSDMMALGAIRAARFHGLAVPDDISVVGFDDSPLIAFTDPPLTTVRQPVRAMAAAAVGALIEEIDGQTVPTSEYVFRGELVVRGSTGPVGTRLPTVRAAAGAGLTVAQRAPDLGA
ncbi:MAG TPA: LacI family DNA-binding transcriptional regulator [Micromonosporaceae bacterium]|nr:LacI family DNA-binding transcriptional regulator [Micromonosporaceae bacterium]